MKDLSVFSVTKVSLGFENQTLDFLPDLFSAYRLSKGYLLKSFILYKYQL